ncbi:hypothetical protein M3Y99_00080500 [Aphelenchoides fujianensis]|nr:hypothetical protein M3Y99_00080500 [Aphelenchoides fujianensis]
MYAGIGYVQATTIIQLNEFLQQKPSDQGPVWSKSGCKAIKQQEVYAPLLKFHSFFMAIFYLLILLLIVAVFLYHRHKIRSSVFPVPRPLQIEMNEALRSLAIVSSTYTLCNFGTTYIEISSSWPSPPTTQEEIGKAVLVYHWLFLGMLVDPILHPLILIRRIRALRLLDSRWRSNLRSGVLSSSNLSADRPPKKKPPAKQPKKTYDWTGETNVPKGRPHRSGAGIYAADSRGAASGQTSMISLRSAR